MKQVEFPAVSIFVCTGSKCGKHKDFRKRLKSEVVKTMEGVEMFKMECSDRCKHAPILCVQPFNSWFEQANESDILSIIDIIKKGQSKL